jgi:surfeit locus 1 family protein
MTTFMHADCPTARSSRGLAAPRLIVLLAALAAVALTARLGVWQLDRAAQKAALAAAIAERGALPPLTALPASDAAALVHRRVVLRGRWSGAHTVYLENRQMQGRPGFYVVTPLLLPDGSALLVQRGWLPRDARDRTRVAEVATPAGEVEVAGRLAPPPARLLAFDPAADVNARLRQNLDPSAFARETGLPLRRDVSLLQQADAPGPAADGLLRDWPAPDAGVAKHHGYAFQWFGLAALIVGLYVWFQLLRPRRPRP